MSIQVATGQIYRCRRPGKPARHVRITRVMRGPRIGGTRELAQPIAFYVETTRSGRRKGALSVRSFLQFRDGAWRMGPGFEAL